MRPPHELQSWLDGTLYPALFARLDAAFPQFGWRHHRRGWQATRWPSDFPEDVDHPNPDRLEVYPDGPAYIKIHGRGVLRFLHLVSGEPRPRGERFVEALRELAARAGIDATPLDREQTPEEQAQAHARDARRAALQLAADVARERLASDAGAEARAYLLGRGLTAADLEGFGLGLYDLEAIRARLDAAGLPPEAKSGVLFAKMQGYATFPWADAWGYPLTLYGRWPAKEAPDGTPKTMALPGSGTKGSPLYLDRALRAGHRELVAVEGLFDALLLQARGETRAVAYVAAQLSTEQLETLRRKGIEGIERVALAGDPDGGGDKGTGRNVEQLEACGIRTAVVPRLPNGLDPDEYVLRDGIEAWRDRVVAAVPGRLWQAQRHLDGLTPQSPEAARRKALDALREVYRRPGPEADLDRETLVSMASRATGYSKPIVRKHLAPPAADEAKASAGSPPPPPPPPSPPWPPGGGSSGSDGPGGPGGPDGGDQGGRPLRPEDLIRDRRGNVVNNLANLASILRLLPAWAGALRFNEATHDIELTHGGPCLKGSFPRAWRDGDEQLVAIWLQTVWRLDAAPGRVLDAALAVARERSYNPLREHLLALCWDGVRRLERWLERYCKVKDSAYARAVGTTWLRSVVARGLQPGAQVDAVLILEGKQGAGKSSVFRILGGPFFVELREVVGDRAVQAMAGKLIGELSELDAMSRHDLAAVKGAVTCPTDRIRLPYARRAIDLPRTVSLGGSCNKSEYLNDETGARRFRPVKVLGDIDLVALRADRDQLLAEAVADVLAGETWHITDKGLLADAAEEAEARRQVDAWEELLEAHLTSATQLPFLQKHGISLGEALEQGIGLKKEQWGQGEQNRVSRILRALGWERRNDVVKDAKGKTEIDPRTGRPRRQWRYHPPPPPPEPPPPGHVPEGGGFQNGSSQGDAKTSGGSTCSSGSTSHEGLGASPNEEKKRVGSGDAPLPPQPSSSEAFSSSLSSTGTTGTTGTKREKQGSESGSSPGSTPSQPSPSGTGTWQETYEEALAAGYPPHEARALADFETGGAPAEQAHA
jgi:predicted P-loop ATPase/DNA-binding transcriptional ArsR family regulator